MKQGILSIALLGALVFAVFTGPDLWAAPEQDPYRQTIATVTPPTSPLETETPTPTEEPPTSTPTPTPTIIPTTAATGTPVPTAVPVPTTIPGTIICYHTVKPGETLFCIGRGYGVDPYAIAIANSIVNPNLIYPGQVLAIPDAPRFLPPGPVCARQCGGPTPVPSSCRWYHTVVWGENLYRISLRYGVSMWAIAEANYIFNLHYIQAGQVLCIP
jgi:LysM repeat protein